MNRQKLLLLAVFALGLLLFFSLGLGRYLSLDYLQHSQSALAARYAANPLAFALAYLLVYVLATALSFPGATVLTLAGGAVFGWAWGLLLVSFASSLGATLAFLAARYVLRDTVQARFGTRLAEIDRGLARDGAWYLFTLRLVPLVPFFVINLAFGLTRMRTLTFYLVSQIGMLAGTSVYVLAGTQLAQVHSLSGILSPTLIASFVLLGLFPLLAPRVVDAFQRRRVYARWAGQRPRRFDRNLIVIGGGAAGLVSAYIAAAVKACVTLVEAHQLGGDCLNTGCVPSKALIQAARVAQQLREAGRYGIASVVPTIDFRAVMQRVRDVIAAIAPHDSVERYTALGVEVLQGKATLINPWTVEVALHDGSRQTLTTRSIVIAAGARPVVPPLPGLDDVGYLTSDTLWDDFAQRDTIPQRIVLLGGGPIGCELAQALARLGAQVTVVEMAERLLLREDEEVSALVAQALSADGVKLLCGHRALRCAVVDGEKTLWVQRADEAEQQLKFDLLICAVGRVARLEGYGLEALGITAERHVPTNDYLQLVYPNIYAAGDVAGPYQFTHAAAHQAWYAAVNALFGSFKLFKADYRVLPSATYTDPELARVGLNEREARAQGIAYELTVFPLRDLDRAIVDGETEGFIKVLTVPGKDRILGVAIVGQHAAELLAEYVLAMKQGLGLNKILGTVHSYPTLAEANKYAAGEWKRAHQPLALLKWVRRYHDWRRG